MRRVPPPGDPGGWEMQPHELREGDQVWAWQASALTWRWARLRAHPEWVRDLMCYRLRLEGIRSTLLARPKDRLNVHREYDQWPVWHGTPPCPACHEPARLVGGTAMLRHSDECPVYARERAGLN